MSPDAVSQAADVMRAWIGDVDDLTKILDQLPAHLHVPNASRNILCGFVSLCGSMLFDLEELRREPMCELLTEYERRAS